MLQRLAPFEYVALPIQSSDAALIAAGAAFLEPDREIGDRVSGWDTVDADQQLEAMLELRGTFLHYLEQTAVTTFLATQAKAVALVASHNTNR